MGHTRRRTPSTEIEDALVSAAFHLLESEGPEALSVRRLAAEAGVAPMGVYNHFDGKNGVVDALFRTAFEVLSAELFDLAEIDDPMASLREGLHRYRTLALDHPRTYEMMFLRAVPGFEPSDASKDEAAAAFGVLVRAIERAQRDGAVRAGDATSIAQQLWAAIHGAVALEVADICMVDDMGPPYDELVDTLLRGIRA